MAYEQSSFPYSKNPALPYTDGELADSNVPPGTMFVPSPGDLTRSMIPRENRGQVVQGYVGDGTSCVDTNTTGHTVLTGSF